jgi:GNAT superfamily N-acetyltransferase
VIRRLTGSAKMRLFRDAVRRGPAAAVRQAWLALADTLWRKKHLVFRATAEEIAALPVAAPPGIAFAEIPSWDALPPAVRARLTDPARPVDWGGRAWFDRGWRLWAAMDGPDRIAALGWWRNAAQSADFFVPVPEDAELLWHATVLPEYRGRRLQVALRVSLMQQRAAAGVRAFFTNCRDYNTPSYRNILAMGFTCIGHCRESRLTGRRSWHPRPQGPRGGFVLASPVRASPVPPNPAPPNPAPPSAAPPSAAPPSAAPQPPDTPRP